MLLCPVIISLQRYFYPSVLHNHSETGDREGRGVCRKEDQVSLRVKCSGLKFIFTVRDHGTCNSAEISEPL